MLGKIDPGGDHEHHLTRLDHPVANRHGAMGAPAAAADGNSPPTQGPAAEQAGRKWAMSRSGIAPSRGNKCRCHRRAGDNREEQEERVPAGQAIRLLREGKQRREDSLRQHRHAEDQACKYRRDRRPAGADGRCEGDEQNR